MVPLAQVLLLDEDESNDTEAESLLLEVVSGRVGGTATAQFRDALLELGRYLSRRGQYAAAIQRLEEAVARFPDHPRGHLASFALAEAHRQDALAIRQTLQEAMPDHRRHMLQQARLERLRRAEDLYEQVRRTLELKETRRRTRLEELQLRNSYFYLGDCAFELGEYEAAIRRYDAARERYPEDPAALVAMVQIVNAYVEQGDLARAATANERARRFYQSLPATAWNDPDLPMSRQDWQRWLDSMTALRPVRTAGVEER
jgi:tetratricopeptide (TPR) repeat protein